VTGFGGFEDLVLPDRTLYAGARALKTRDVLADEDPCTGESFADIAVASVSDVADIVMAAHSGLGRENGPEALDAYLEPKTVVTALS
jgi:acyl-CoA reductase-like NAD-dependent aldehyde dehydrogenase